jgi:hypothetical protein
LAAAASARKKPGLLRACELRQYAPSPASPARAARAEDEARQETPHARRSVKELQVHKNPQFWALAVAIWICLYLSFINISSKIDLFMRLSG